MRTIEYAYTNPGIHLDDQEVDSGVRWQPAGEVADRVWGDSEAPSVAIPESTHHHCSIDDRVGSFDGLDDLADGEWLSYH